MNTLFAIFNRDLLLAFRRGGSVWTGLGFFLLVVVLSAFALGPQNFSIAMTPIACVAALLAVQLGAASLLEADWEDGSLEQYLLMPLACEWVVLGKLTAWICSGAVPLVLAAVCALWLAGAADTLRVMLALLLALPALGALALFASALTLAVRRAGLLQAVVVLPLNIPVLIFTVAAASGQAGAFSALTGVTAMCVVLSSLSSAALIRMAAE